MTKEEIIKEVEKINPCFKFNPQCSSNKFYFFYNLKTRQIIRIGADYNLGQIIHILNKSKK